jgi:membrane-bound lytic murein transglycosylase D
MQCELMMIGISNIKYKKIAKPNKVSTIQRQKLNVFFTLVLFSFFAVSPQGDIYAGDTGYMKSHLSKAETSLDSTKPESQLKLHDNAHKLDPLLEEINPDDLVKARTLAKRNYLQHWDIIAKRSRYVRYRLLKSLKQRNVPISLQAIPIVESSYDPYAFSKAGASGLWQLMPGTARELGLHPSNGRDGRRNVKHATEAAIEYLSMLYDRFHSWPLSIAAYNMGPNGLERRLKKSPWKNPDGLDNMPIPLTTRIYVKRIIGLAALLHNGELSLPEPVETRLLLLQPPIDVIRLVQLAGMEKEEIFRINPSLNQAQYLKRPISVHVPISKYKQLKAKIKLAGPEYHKLTIHEGDSLWKIAQAINTSVGNIRRLNPGVVTKLSIGQKLRVPANKVALASPSPNPLLSSGRRIRYKVRSGDSLWRIAHRFGTTPKAIARSNQLSLKALIRPGDTLWVLARLK